MANIDSVPGGALGQRSKLHDPTIISEIPAPTPGDSRFTLVAGSDQSWQLPRHFYVASASGTCGRIKYSARCKRRTSIAALGRDSDSDCDSSTAALKKINLRNLEFQFL